MKPSAFPQDPGMNSYLFLFILFFVISPVNNAGPVQLTVNGPLHPVTASLSEDIVLRCHLSPRTSAENMEITWFRSQNSSYVHLYHSGKDHLEKQQPEYQGRTEILTDGIGDGKIGLRILNVSFFDEGQYHCSVKNRSFHQEAILDIKVAGSSNQPLTCVVRNILLNQEKGSTIHMADNLFTMISSWTAGLCVSLLISFGLVIAILYLINRNRKLITELSWRKMVVPIEKANVTLDPDTANHDLILSADQKNVIQGFMWNSLPDNPQRFDTERCVLGKEGFCSGRHYWEVEVGEDGYWAVGVARYSVKRKGRLSLDPDEGIWAVEKYWVQTVQYQALTIPQTPLPLRKRPRKLGIYLDYELEQVAFHDVNHKMHIFTFSSADFNEEKIFPFLHVGVGCWLRLRP
ncbi:butyrophilin subfamily 3 member A3-like isoform X3 [Sceloporus undulatus]|uniref:butyrophilin subfamily 3 member A3-like isoform X3 n=1 Tax=Sceloporus undulatus TaxID=8520 RepID=UPI001C4B420A|nr:butyrophilin subfamily 3 member A3-like isoform X3 [Sceloporus undulatus]